MALVRGHPEVMKAERHDDGWQVDEANQSEERLKALKADASGTPLYEQFVQDKIARRAAFVAENKTLVE